MGFVEIEYKLWLSLNYHQRNHGFSMREEQFVNSPSRYGYRILCVSIKVILIGNAWVWSNTCKAYMTSEAFDNQLKYVVVL